MVMTAEKDTLYRREAALLRRTRSSIASVTKPSDDAGRLLGPLEREVMAILWKVGSPMTVRGLLERIVCSNR